MNCDACQAKLSEFLDKELHRDEMDLIDSHLSACAHCAAELAVLSRLAETTRALPQEAPGLDISISISEMIHKLAHTTRQTEFGPVLDVDELADYLHIDKVTIDVYLDELPYFELGGKLLFRKTSIEQWIEKREMQIRAQAEQAVLAAAPELQDILKGDLKWTL